MFLQTRVSPGLPVLYFNKYFTLWHFKFSTQRKWDPEGLITRLYFTVKGSSCNQMASSCVKLQYSNSATVSGGQC